MFDILFKPFYCSAPSRSDIIRFRPKRNSTITRLSTFWLLVSWCGSSRAELRGAWLFAVIIGILSIFLVSDRRLMIPRTPLPHMIEYVDALNETLREKGHKPLSKIQSSFLCFVLMEMLLTQSLCWARLERASGGRYQDGTLSKMFYHGLKCWEHLLTASALIVMRRFKITSGVLVLDDTDRGRFFEHDQNMGHS